MNLRTILSNYLISRKIKRQEAVARHNRWCLDEIHDQWVHCVTDPLQKGIQPDQKYKCAYCGTVLLGKDIVNKQTCPKCGALLNG